MRSGYVAYGATHSLQSGGGARGGCNVVTEMTRRGSGSREAWLAGWVATRLGGRNIVEA